MEGWCYSTADINGSIAIVDGQRLVSRDICGVFTRMHCVMEDDLGHIVPEDRAYVAAEMSAFLLAWLTSLRCPMLNRPTPTSLLGPYLRYEKWILTAARLGIPVAASRRYALLSNRPIIPEHNGVTVTIIGQKYFGEVDPILARQARSLADAARVDLLSVRFSGHEPGSLFMGAGFDMNIIPENMADAILEYLLEKQDTKDCQELEG